MKSCNGTLLMMRRADASPYGVGAVLSHIVDGVERPVAYVSRTLTDAEKNYSQVEREALAIILGVTVFNKFLYGRKFTLFTDHEAFTVIFGPKRADTLYCCGKTSAMGTYLEVSPLRHQIPEVSRSCQC